MTIHRTREGSEPSGGAEQGRNIIQLGDVFVEYSGPEPTQADLDALREISPQPLDAEELYDILKAKGVIADIDRPRPQKK